MKRAIICVCVSLLFFSFTSNKNVKAESNYQKSYSEDEKKNMQYYYDLAIRYIKENNNIKTIEAFENYSKINPKNDYVNYVLAVAYNKIKDHQKAMKYLNVALSINSKKYEYYYLEGNIFLALGKVQEAIHSWEDSIQLNPNYDDSHYNMGYTLLKNKMYPESVKFLTNCLRINKNHKQASDLIKGLYEFYLSDSIKNVSADTYYSLSRALNYINEFDKSIEISKKGLTFYPNNATLYNNLGGSYLEKNQIDDAIFLFKKSIILDSKDIYPYFLLADSYKRKGDYNKAIENYNIIFTLEDKFKVYSPLYKNIYHSLGVIYDKKLMLTEATTNFKKACELGIKEDCNYIQTFDGKGKVKNLKELNLD